MKKTQQILLGVILIAIGGLIGLKALGAIEFEIFFDGWWTLFIIIPCFLALFGEGKKGEKIGDLIGVLIGVLLMLGCLEVIDFKIIWGMILPLFLVIIGLLVIGKSITTGKATKREKEIRKESEDRQIVYAIFSEEKTSISRKDFGAMTATALFGGADLDFSQGEITEDAVITARAMFGNVKIKLPEGVNLEINSTALFGETRDDFSKEKQGKNAKNPTVHVNSFCLFGGVKIR